MRIRGTYDVLPTKMRLYKHICGVFDRICHAHGYEEVMTPILEHIALFERTLGASSDVVSKEMFVVRSQKEEDVVLRPENTAGAMRLFLEHFLQDTPKRLCYFGPMFRYERPQQGRHRQFYQFGVECVGVSGWPVDVEVMLLAWRFIEALGIHKYVRIEVNTIGSVEERRAYKDALRAYLLPFENDLSCEARSRLDANVLRVLDTKNSADKAILLKAPRIKDYLGEISKNDFEAVCSSLKSLGMPFVCNDFLVRGLDYYNHNVFEFVSDDLGAQGAILGGGRYDGLATILNKKHDVCAVGWAAGMERIAALVEKVNPFVCDKPASIALVVLQESDVVVAHNCGHELYCLGLPYVVLFEGALRKKMKIASRIGASFVVLFGVDEMSKGLVVVRNMQDGHEEVVPLSKVAMFMEKKYRANAC